MYSPRTGLPIEHVVVKHFPDRTGKQVAEWVVDLVDLASGGLLPGTPAMPLLPTAPLTPAASIMRKRRPAEDVSGSDQR